MRPPFNFNDTKFDQDDSRIKFSFTSPELNQNIEISLDANEISVEALLDAFHRFLGALGICTPENIILGFVEVDENENLDDIQEEKE